MIPLPDLLLNPAAISVQGLVERDVTEPTRFEIVPPPIPGQHQGQDFHESGCSDELIREDHLQQKVNGLHQIVLREDSGTSALGGAVKPPDVYVPEKTYRKD